MATHLAVVKMQVTPAPAEPDIYWAWCETCHRNIGPRWEHSIGAQDLCEAHEVNPVLSDFELMALLPDRGFTS
jgi:hypothetical protein